MYKCKGKICTEFLKLAPWGGGWGVRVEQEGSGDCVSLGTSLVVQWLRLPSSVGCVGLIPGWGAKIFMAKKPKQKTEKVL